MITLINYTNFIKCYKNIILMINYFKFNQHTLVYISGLDNF